MSYKLAGVMWNDDGTMATKMETKELTPLEALNEMISKFVEILLEVKCEKPTAINVSYLNNTLRVAFHDKLGIIETALKEYERMTYLCNGCVQHSETYYKEKKAFEIIKEKRVDITTLMDCHNAEEYNRWVPMRSHYSYRPFELTQEEFDLLRKVLL